MSKKPWASKSSSNIYAKYSTGQIYEDNEKDLVMSVIRECCKEYRQAYKSNNIHAMDYLERWFYGPQFEEWTEGKIHPDSLLRGIRQQVDSNKYKMYQDKRIMKDEV